MTKRLIDRQHSQFVAERVLSAHRSLKHLTADELDAAVREHNRLERQADNAPEHIKVIRRLGILDAARGYTAEDVSKWQEAVTLVNREVDHPRDFVSGPIDSAARSDTAAHQACRKQQAISDTEIANWIEHRFGPYRENSNKKDAVISAQDRFSISRAKVLSALKKSGLTGQIKK